MDDIADLTQYRMATASGWQPIYAEAWTESDRFTLKLGDISLRRWGPMWLKYDGHTYSVISYHDAMNLINQHGDWKQWHRLVADDEHRSMDGPEMTYPPDDAEYLEQTCDD